MSSIFGTEEQYDSEHVPQISQFMHPQGKFKSIIRKIFSIKSLWLLVGLLIASNIYTYVSLSHENTRRSQELNSLQSAQKTLQDSLLQTKIDFLSFQQTQAKQHIVLYTQFNKSHTHSPNKNTLPLDLPFLNQKGQMIQQVLYDPPTQRQRLQFNIERERYINLNNNLSSLHLAKYNLILTINQKMAAQADFQAQWRRIQDKFQLSKISTELPMCVIVPGYNNNANFRIQSNLNSIFTQNYSNYRVIVINDASTDGSGQTYRRYFDFYGIDPARYTYIENTVRVTAVENIYRASTQHCAKEDIVVTVDADDQLLGRNALKVFNWAFQTKKLGVVYSNFYFYQQSVLVKQGFTQDHTAEQKANNQYRDVKMKFSHLRAYRNELFLKIDPKDLKDEAGSFYKIIYDQAIFFPLMEMSCGRVAKIKGEYHLLYMTNTGLNDWVRGDDLGDRTQKRIRAAKKYECDKQFDQKIKIAS